MKCTNYLIKLYKYKNEKSERIYKILKILSNKVLFILLTQYSEHNIKNIYQKTQFRLSFLFY